MKRRVLAFRLGVLVVGLMVAGLTAACSSGFSPGPSKASPTPVGSSSTVGKVPSSGPVPSNRAVQSDGQGAVTIDMKWLGQQNGSLLVGVSINTHSVGLDGYDFRELAVMRDSAGNVYRPASWEAPPGGHHRSGLLTFPLPPSLAQGQTKSLQVVVRDVAGIKERVFKWELA